MKMQFKEYMNQTFPGVTLVPYIYFQWENHLHFDFGKDKYQFKEEGNTYKYGIFHTTI